MTGRLWRGGMVFGGLMLLWGLASRSGIPHFLYRPAGGRRGAMGKSRLSRLAYAYHAQ